MFNLKPASESRNIAMMEVMSAAERSEAQKKILRWELAQNNWNSHCSSKIKFAFVFRISIRRTNLFCSAKELFCLVNFFPPIFFFGFLEKENPSKQIKILAGKKLTEQKRLSLIKIGVSILTLYSKFRSSHITANLLILHEPKCEKPKIVFIKNETAQAHGSRQSRIILEIHAIGKL